MSKRTTFAALCAFLVAGPAMAIATLSDPISSERPLFVFAAPGEDAPDSLAHADRFLSAWQSLPESLRPFCALELESPVTDEAFWPDRFRDVLREMQFSSIPVVVKIANGDPRAFYPLTDLAQLLEEFTTIRGLHVEGLAFNEYYTFGEMDPLGIPPQTKWLMGAIEVAGQYGRLITIQLDELHWPRIMSNAWCKPLYDTIRNHKANVIPLNGQRGPQNVTRSSALLGLWLEDAVDQWGLECSSDWYREARFIEPGVFGAAGEGVRMPPTFYRAMVLNGAMAGAAVYRFDRAEDLWFGASRYYWDDVILPTLTEIVERGYIARKDLVQRKVRIAYRLNPAQSAEEFRANLADIDAVYGEGHMLKGAYGVERPGQVPELVLNTGRYYWLPILSPYALDEALRQFEEVILPGALLDAQSWRERLDLYYAPDGGGEAFVSRIGRGIFVMHTRENLYEEQSFQLAALPAPVRAITAERLEHGIRLSWPFREGDLFYRVYRRVLPETDYTLLASDVDARHYVDETAGNAGTVAYTVTALTNEREPYEGTINYGDFLVFNTVESRFDEEVLLDAFTRTASSTKIVPPQDERPKTQEWWPTGLEGFDENEAFVARAVAARIEEWEQAYQAEDLDRVTGLYAEDYEDAFGRGIEYVRTAYDLLFKLYRAGQMHRQIRSWDLSGYSKSGEVGLVLYCRFTAIDEVQSKGRYADLPVSFPDIPSGEVQLLFAQRDGAWRILRTDPPLPHMDDFIVTP
ncbi:MAG: hypothetical protein IID09_02620 [Candidatus Hydrogenedentes bacterium]|nr:hypothetical protein [Candidatus Hydrogenedentota bacterium]